MHWKFLGEDGRYDTKFKIVLGQGITIRGDEAWIDLETEAFSVKLKIPYSAGSGHVPLRGLYTNDDGMVNGSEQLLITWSAMSHRDEGSTPYTTIECVHLDRSHGGIILFPSKLPYYNGIQIDTVLAGDANNPAHNVEMIADLDVHPTALEIIDGVPDAQDAPPPAPLSFGWIRFEQPPDEDEDEDAGQMAMSEEMGFITKTNIAKPQFRELPLGY